MTLGESAAESDGLNMPRTLAEILASGELLDLDWLAVEPASTDPASWQLVQGSPYRRGQGVPEIIGNLDQGGFAFNIRGLLPPQGDPVTITHIGISYQGSALFVSPIANPSVFPGDDFKNIIVSGTCNPVLN